jgi:hypothetical protein
MRWLPRGNRADLETDVLARASAGLAGSTIRNDTGHLRQITPI